jgi:hypothetical protein
MDYSNDSPTAGSPRGGLSQARDTAASAGSSIYGWFAGGQTAAAAPVSTIDRIDFSNDSPTTAGQRGSLFATRNYVAGVSNYVKSQFPITLGDGENYGSLFGGLSYGWITATPTTSSKVDRIDFSNDTATAVQRGITTQRDNSAGVSNTNYGWSAGGDPNPNRSTVDRIDFSNDSATATVRGLLSLGRVYLSGVSNNNYGWFGGGYTPGPTMVSVVDRIDFSNDSPSTASPHKDPPEMLTTDGLLEDIIRQY